jgi:hypothetical protein
MNSNTYSTILTNLLQARERGNLATREYRIEEKQPIRANVKL